MPERLPYHVLKTQFALPPWGGLLVVALSTLSVFAVLATLTRDLGREDWAYVGRWLKLQPLARQ